MTIGRRIIGSMSGMLFLALLLAGTGIGMMAWLLSWRGDYVDAARQAGALTDAGLQAMLSSLDGRAIVAMSVMGVITLLVIALSVAALVRLGPTVDRRLRGAVASISTSVAELLAVAGEVAAAASQTDAATNETTATVEEVKQTAVLAEEKSSEALELANVVLESSKLGEISVRRNHENFERVQGSMDVVASAIERLDEEVGSIGDVMTLVSDLAEQSNLLAVNASIEAYKSGEAGKGFEVVAQEVKSLAGQSKQAVEQVRHVLSEIRRASHEVTRSIEEVRASAEWGRGDAVEAIGSIGKRVAAAGSAAEATMQISATSRQQLAGMEQISQAVLSISEAGRRSVSGVRQVEKEAAQLRELALALERLVQAGSRRAD